MKKILLVIVLFILLGSLIYGGYTLYEELPRNPTQLRIQTLENPDPINSNQFGINQFSPNIRFNHKEISYKIDFDCSSEKREKMIEAFQTLSKETEILSFIESATDIDIQVSCSQIELQKGENLFIAGEGGPSKYVNNTIYPVILKGRILLYEQSQCKSSIVEMHELLHVFGFDHSEDKTDMMYPKTDCTQELKQAYIQMLKDLYKIEPKSELYFKEAENITKAGKYLGFDVMVVNYGIIDAKEVNLTIYADSQKVESFDLGEINLGEGKRFSVKNLKLPSINTKEIELKIESNNSEYDYNNNIIRAN